MVPEEYPVTRKTTTSIYSRQEKDITAICQHRIISGQNNFIRELLKPLPATERSLLEAKVPSVKRRISRAYADLRELFLEMELLRAAQTQADIQRTTCGVGTSHIWHEKAHDCAYPKLQVYPPIFSLVT